MRYARDETVRQLRDLPGWERGLSRAVLGVVAVLSTDRLIHPQVYAAVGLDPRAAKAAARSNPHWAATRRHAARKAVDFFTEQGLISPLDRRLFWRSSGLVA